MKRKNEVNCTALGVSNKSRIIRMNRAGAAGVAFTAVGLILSACELCHSHARNYMASDQR